MLCSGVMLQRGGFWWNVLFVNCDVFVGVDSDHLQFCILCVDIRGYVQICECYVLLKVSKQSSSKVSNSISVNWCVAQYNQYPRCCELCPLHFDDIRLCSVYQPFKLLVMLQTCERVVCVVQNLPMNWHCIHL